MSWIPQSLRTYDGEPVMAEDAGRPEVHASLMRRQRNTLVAAVASVVPTVLLFSALLWRHTSHTGLIIWILLVTSNSIAHWLIHLRLPLEEVTVSKIAISHAFGGSCWATLTLVAMPPEPEWQAMVGTVMIAVLAAGLVFASQFALPFAAWVLSISIGSTIGFLLLGSTLGNALAVLSCAAAAFSLLLGAVLRAGDLGAAVFAARNADLVAELQAEKLHLRELANTDPLTGVGNRLAYSKDLDHVIQGQAGSAALALIDLDDFKHINDSQGHHVGDQVLRAITKRIVNSLLPAERLYRIGGDELTVVQRRDADSQSVEELGQRLLANFAVPVKAGVRQVEISASVGIAEVDGSHDAEALQRGADEALYLAKRSPGSTVAHFDAALRVESAQKAKLQVDVANALTTGQIVPWLQPVVNLRTGAIIGAEALARWQHPDGVRSAASFIPAIEESGTAPTLDRIVFDAVVRYQADLSKIHGSDFFLSFNISPAFLRQFLDTYEASNKLTGCIIEITEQRDLTNHAHLAALLARAQDAGAMVVVDDFGTGFSSMERLNLGSFDGLKIDGGFVQSLTDRDSSAAIIASIAEIGRRLRVPVVAEAIETHQHAVRLFDCGIRWGQGYLYSPAMPIDELAEVVARQRVNGPAFAHLAVDVSTQLESHR